MAEERDANASWLNQHSKPSRNPPTADFSSSQFKQQSPLLSSSTHSAHKDPSKFSPADSKMAGIATMPIPQVPSNLHRSYSLATSASSQPSSVFSSRPSPASTELSANSIGPSSKERRSSSVCEPTIVEAAQLAGDATLRFGDHEIRLASYEVLSTWKGRTVVWNRGVAGFERLEQKLPAGHWAFPYTTHSSLTRHVNGVSFLKEHEIKCFGKTFREVPRYSFAEPADSIGFQSAIRKLQLVATFEVTSISTSMSRKPGDATDQHLKLWKSKSSSRHYLTYYANGSDQPSHREFPIRWFDRPATHGRSKSPKTLCLSFLKLKRLNSGDSRRSSAAMSPVNAMTTGMDPISLSDTPEWASRSSSVISFADDSEPVSTPSEEANKLKYLDVVFTTREDCDRFLDTVIAAYDHSLDVEMSALLSPSLSAPAQTTTASGKAPTPPMRRATPAGILGLNLSMEALGLE